MIEEYSNNLRDLINKKPIIKYILKSLFGNMLNKNAEFEVTLYNQWLDKFYLDDKAIIKQKILIDDLKYKPLISIVTPTYNTPEKYFIEMIESVLSQTYNNWELILVDDASSSDDIRNLIKRYSNIDSRIKYKFLKDNHHIAGATNEAIKIASGEFISLFDHDDILQVDALYEIIRVLNYNQDIDFIYSDEDKVFGDEGRRSDPFFKPDWNPDFLYSINYITHFTTIRKTLFNNFGFEDGNYNGAQDWELFLRITRNTPNNKIYHIPKILYSWRVHSASTAMNLTSKPYVTESQRRAIIDDLSYKNESNYLLKQDDLYPGQWELTFKPITTPKISIAVFSNAMKNYVNSHTTYEDFEVIVISKEYVINEVLENMKGEYVVLIDMKIKINNKNWIELLLGDAERLDIGFVVARYKSVSEAFKMVSPIINQSALHLLKKFNTKSLTKHYYVTARYNIPKIEKGCVFMVNVGKLNELMNDRNANKDIVDLSKEMALYGYRNLYNPYVKL